MFYSSFFHNVSGAVAPYPLRSGCFAYSLENMVHPTPHINNSARVLNRLPPPKSRGKVHNLFTIKTFFVHYRKVLYTQK